MAHHEPFKALGPVAWQAVPRGDVSPFLSKSFSAALTVIESIPRPHSISSSASGLQRPGPLTRRRSNTDPGHSAPTDFAKSSLSTPDPQVGQGKPCYHLADNIANAECLRREWKEVKMNAKDNPLSIGVYKLSSKDGKGSWFARTSLHEGVSFERWKRCLEKEFAETMKTKGSAGSGSIRGIGAERLVEREQVAGFGKMEVFQLSAQFPGPVAPRDFITLALTAESETGQTLRKRPLRSFIVLSKPCVHPECPPRSGFIRGQYESVEIIREVASDRDRDGVKRSRSSIDLGQHRRSGTATTKHIRASQETSQGASEGRQRSATTAGDAVLFSEDDADMPVAIEWLMVTRSDPGGSVPRFMIEKGTPGGIVTDAGKFIKWMNERPVDNFADEGEGDDDIKQRQQHLVRQDAAEVGDSAVPRNQNLGVGNAMQGDRCAQDADGQQNVPSSNGLYGILASAIGTAASVATRLPNPFAVTGERSTPTVPEADEEGDSSTLASSASSVRSFASAIDTQPDDVVTTSIVASGKDEGELAASLDQEGTLPVPPPANTSAEKELRKIEARRAKFAERLAKMQARLSTRQASERQRDEQAMVRAREKHERDMAKQEEKYRRELRRLEEKRVHEEKKAEERRKKASEKEEKRRLELELDRIREERDLAQREIEVLKDQVGDLQAQNTLLVARYGRPGTETTGGQSQRSDGTGSGASSVNISLGGRTLSAVGGKHGQS